MSKGYFEWLCNRVGIDLRRYRKLASTLYSTQFKWVGDIPMDGNRAADGIVLRDTYGEEDFRPCTVLEMLVSLSERMDDIIGDPGVTNYTKWFWIMLHNVELDFETDDQFREEEVYDVLKCWMQRDFDYNGRGGLFPLRHPFEDQRDISIWDQMASYINENY